MRSGDTPVPIPNTKVKPGAADGTALETVRESRRLPDPKRGLSSAGRAPALQAGGRERTPDKREVGGSSPLKPTEGRRNEEAEASAAAGKRTCSRTCRAYPGRILKGASGCTLKTEY